jgi:hypothetical protein
MKPVPLIANDIALELHEKPAHGNNRNAGL